MSMGNKYNEYPTKSKQIQWCMVLFEKYRGTLGFILFLTGNLKSRKCHHKEILISKGPGLRKFHVDYRIMVINMFILVNNTEFVG